MPGSRLRTLRAQQSSPDSLPRPLAPGVELASFRLLTEADVSSLFHKSSSFDSGAMRLNGPSPLLLQFLSLHHTPHSSKILAPGWFTATLSITNPVISHTDGPSSNLASQFLNFTCSLPPSLSLSRFFDIMNSICKHCHTLKIKYPTLTITSCLSGSLPLVPQLQQSFSTPPRSLICWFHLLFIAPWSPLSSPPTRALLYSPPWMSIRVPLSPSAILAW